MVQLIGLPDDAQTLDGLLSSFDYVGSSSATASSSSAPGLPATTTI
jgi:hypothetical protein